MTREEKKWFDDYFGVTRDKQNQRWTLKFNDNVICSNVCYPVCMSNKNKMIADGGYTGMTYLFKIEKFN